MKHFSKLADSFFERAVQNISVSFLMNQEGTIGLPHQMGPISWAELWASCMPLANKALK